MSIRGWAKKKSKLDPKRRPINILASVFTTLNLYCGVLSIFASFGQEFEKAALLILCALLFDAFDGFIARLTQTNSEFGKELDSLCDMVSFGLAPAILVFSAYIPDTTMHASPFSSRAESIIGKTGSYMAIIYVICAALRLARFNTFQAGRRDSFIGLPSPAAATSVATFVLFLQYFEPKLATIPNGVLAYYALGPLALIVALLMVSTVPYPRNRLRSFLLSPRHAFRALGTFAFAVAIIHYAFSTSPYLVLFPLTAVYVLFGLADYTYTHISAYLMRRRSSTSEGKHSTPHPLNP